MQSFRTKKEKHVEGEFYKKVELYGRTFDLYYGYYEECDRNEPLFEPIVIYPDFVKQPIYTDDGLPFATVIQDACDNYEGKVARNEDTTCADCEYFSPGEEWFGICKHPYRTKKNE